MTDTVALGALRWRTGRKLGRTIYAILDEEDPNGDALIGLMDSIALAQWACRDHNAMLDATMVRGSLE